MKKSSIRKRSKPLTMTAPAEKKDKVRLAIECTAEQRKYQDVRCFRGGSSTP